MAPQSLDPLPACPLEPLADGASGHPERGGDILLFPALLVELPGASPPSLSPLAPVELRCPRLHGASIASFYISTQGSVGKRYGQHWALRQLSLRCEPGMLGLVGPNGAGKTTLMRMIGTLLDPTEGTICWKGHDTRTHGQAL
jgi:ABC-type multidrug transport system fused ATPase/permease subunit